MPKMNPEIKQLWIEALRSGQYKQGRGFLHNITQNAFCPLGVLCDLFLKEKKLTWTPSYLEDKSTIGLVFGSRYTLPKPVCTWADIEFNIITLTKAQAHIAYLNDTTQLSFIQLADLIEQEL